MSSNTRCDDCGGFVIPGQGKWIPPGAAGRRRHKSPELCRKALERAATNAASARSQRKVIAQYLGGLKPLRPAQAQPPAAVLLSSGGGSAAGNGLETPPSAG
jgi:hypothetical protein